MSEVSTPDPKRPGCERKARGSEPPAPNSRVPSRHRGRALPIPFIPVEVFPEARCTRRGEEREGICAGVTGDVVGSESLGS